MNLQEINDAFKGDEVVTDGERFFTIVGIAADKPKEEDGDILITIEYLQPKARVYFYYHGDRSTVTEWSFKKDSPIIEDQKTDEFAISMTTVSSNNFMLLTNHGRVFYKDLIKDGEPWRELNLPDYKSFK